MELRNAENQTNVLMTSYLTFRRSAVHPPLSLSDDANVDAQKMKIAENAVFRVATVLPSWNVLFRSVVRTSSSSSTSYESTDATTDNEAPTQTDMIADNNTNTNGGDDDGDDNDDLLAIIHITARDLLTQLREFLLQVQSLESLMTKFRQRMNMKDPVTQQPRYGDKTMKRVVDLLQKFDALQLAVNVIERNENSAMMSEYYDNKSSSSSLVTLMEEWVKVEDVTRNNKIRQEEWNYLQKREIEEKKQRELQALKQQEKLREELRLKKEREELAARAEKARLQRLREEEEAKRLVRDKERNYLASIPKGVEGVKLMLERLRRACEGNKKDLDVALDALHTLFSQIASRPEDVQFRRVRRDHPKFLEDIGRHDGGKEVLIAAGFVFAEVDGVDCFFSKEPDLEHDMDAWSQWFDVIKGTISAIEEEMIKG
jgi:hypothetical protein